MTKPTPNSERPTCAPGDVVVAPFSYFEQLAEKRRPALVVSNQSVHSLGFVWPVTITSAARPRREHDASIVDLAAAGLSAPSVVRPEKIACVEPSRILRAAGRLDDVQAARIFALVRSFVGAPKRK